MPGRLSNHMLWVTKSKVPHSIIRWHSHITHLKQCSQKHCIISSFKEQSVLSVTFFDVGPICTNFLITMNNQKMVS